MQKLSACRNRASETHRFSSTMMRCMTAIWPAGPPKLRAATFSHTRNASRIEGNSRGAGAAAVAATASDNSGSRFLRMPRMGFFRGIPTPPIECVVECHPGFELCKVIRIHARQAKRGGKQAGGLRRGIHAPDVGAAHDRGKAEQRPGRKT